MDADRFAERLAAQRRIDQETAITRIDLLRSQLQAETPISRGRSSKVKKLRVLAKGYARSFLIQQVWLDAGLLNYFLSRQTGGPQPLGNPLRPDRIDGWHRGHCYPA